MDPYEYLVDIPYYASALVILICGFLIYYAIDEMIKREAARLTWEEPDIHGSAEMRDHVGKYVRAEYSSATRVQWYLGPKTWYERLVVLAYIRVFSVRCHGVPKITFRLYQTVTYPSGLQEERKSKTGKVCQKCWTIWNI